MSLNQTVNYQLIPEGLRNFCCSWLAQDKNESTRSEIINLISGGDWDELHKRLDTRISFGTAGLRARMEAGFNRMNSLVVIQATQGLASYIKSKFPDNLVAVIGHDHRYHSEEFAIATAGTFLEAGFKVIFVASPNGYNHTPLVPFTVDEVGASVGVMITASHNPKEDNGYKVYYANGCQIIPPHDSAIADSINGNLELWTRAWDSQHVIDEALSEDRFVYAHNNMTERYIKKVQETLLDHDAIASLRSNSPWFVYTAMHGVGFQIFSKVMSRIFGLTLGQDYLNVPEQSTPDQDFPTVSFPNPEEKGALDLSIALAEKNGISLVLANDPDADRFSAAVKDQSTGAWKQLSGNQIGFLFAFYELQLYKGKTSEFKQKHPLALLNSTVSSQMIKKMAEIEKFHYEDTLTGFKWIGNRAISLTHEGWYVPFSFEEAIGYMFPQMEFDKDGVSAAIVFLQAFGKWSSDLKKTPLDVLNEANEKYGFFKEHNGYFTVTDPKMLASIFQKIRQYRNLPNKPYPTELGSEFDIISFRDLTVGYQSDTKDNKPTLPVDPTSQMVTIEARPRNSESDEHVRFTIRGSGTEPKLKIYIESYSLKESRAQLLSELISRVLQREWLVPGVGGLSKEFHRT